MSHLRTTSVFAFAVLTMSTSVAGWAADDGSSPDLVCYRVKDPLAVSGSVVTSSAALGVSPPCRIDAAATEICVPASAAAVGEIDARRVPGVRARTRNAAAGNGGSGDAASTNARALAAVSQQAQLCYSIECPDDVAPPAGAVSDALGNHDLDGFRAARLCVPASFDETGAGAAGSHSESAATDDGAGSAAEEPSVITREQGCGDANADGGISASDALATLRTAVGITSGCGSCACDVNNSTSITASDALSVLRAAVGQAVTLECPEGPFFIAWDGGGDGTSWQDPINWDKDGVPRFCDSVTIDVAAEASVVFRTQTLSILALTSAEDLTIENGSLTLRQASTESAKLTITGGSLTVADTLTANDFDWQGGSIVNAGTTTVTGALTIEANGKNFDGGTMIVDGSATWSASPIFARNGATLRINSGRTFEITGDVSFLGAGGDKPTIDNDGTLLKSGGTGTTQVSGLIDSAGTVDLRTGTFLASGDMTIAGPFTVTAPALLDLSGTNAFEPASNLGGTGAVTFGGGTTTVSGTYGILGQASITNGTAIFAVPATIPDLTQTGGAFRVDETAEITNTFQWQGGSIQDAGTTTVTGTLTIDSNGKNFDGGTMIVDGPATWSSSPIFARNGAVLHVNSGRTFEITGDVSFLAAGGAKPTIDNEGTLLKSGGTGTTQNSGLLDSSGTVDLRAGTFLASGDMTIAGPFTVTAPALLDLSGTNDFAAASNLGGTGAVTFGGGTTTISGTYGILGQASITNGTAIFAVPATIPDLTQTGGAFRVDETAEITNTFQWQGGSIQDAGTTTVTGTLTIDSNGKNFDGGTMIVDGPATWSSSPIFARNGAVLHVNSGRTFEITGDVSFLAAGGATPVFENAGTVDKSDGTGTSQVSGAFQNDGSLELHTGMFQCSGGYTQSASAALATDVAGVGAASIGTLSASTATLDGDLEVVITGGYTPQVNDTFSVLSYTTRSGTFATITPANLPGGLSLVETYGATALSFEVQ